MTTFDAEKLARGWSLIAEGAMEISLAYSALEPASAREAVPSAVPSGAAARPEGVVPPAPSGPPPLKAQVDAGLAICPTHGVPWTVKAGGVSKNGKRYSAFWKCAERDADGYCDEKPQRIWADVHPPEVAA